MREIQQKSRSSSWQPYIQFLIRTRLHVKKPKYVTPMWIPWSLSPTRYGWIVASTIDSVNNEVYVYDSVYGSLDKETVVLNLFQGSLLPVQMAEIQKQDGGCDCGLFAIAVATALAFRHNPRTLTFEQTFMRPHLIQCFEKGELILFPTI